MQNVMNAGNCSLLVIGVHMRINTLYTAIKKENLRDIIVWVISVHGLVCGVWKLNTFVMR